MTSEQALGGGGSGADSGARTSETPCLWVPVPHILPRKGTDVLSHVSRSRKGGAFSQALREAEIGPSSPRGSPRLQSASGLGVRSCLAHSCRPVWRRKAQESGCTLHASGHAWLRTQHRGGCRDGRPPAPRVWKVWKGTST